ncbi:hypothetical protein DFP72DRAFT_873396 [Ephemerocybe angulata]|uniref:ABM domain-containing protein n=1 Tax=Ephemerocybe angulata TaxID=980116 RepID=A0A8H6IG92_9AGAR|nr:hypothetical protein DFP72DRAFT_873396 [Tulosesus angulatus]
MTITELAILPLKPPHTVHNPRVEELFQMVHKRQSDWSSYPVLYFADEAGTTIYLLSGWENVAAHQELMKSDGNQEMLGLFQEYIDLEKMKLRHLDIPFEKDGRLVEAEFLGYASQTEGGEVEAGEGHTWKAEGRDLEEEAGSGTHHIAAYTQAPVDGTGHSVKLHKRVYHHARNFGSALDKDIPST